MNLHYGLHQPLRVYESAAHRNRFKVGNYGRPFKLYCPTSHVLPFQIQRSPIVNPLTILKAIDTSDNSETDLLALMSVSETEIFPFPSYDQIVHYGIQELSAAIPQGEYYLEISDGVNTWYTEDITYVDFDPTLAVKSCILTKITYWDTCDIGGILYRMKEFNSFAPQYKNVLYLDTPIGNAEYEQEDDGEEDGEGNFYPDSIKVEKRYGVEQILPEFMLDAAYLIPMHLTRTGTVEVLTEFGYTGEVDDMVVTHEWEGKFKVYAKSELRFSTNYILKTNCCEGEDPLTGCIRVAFEVVDCLEVGATPYTNFEYDTGEDPAVYAPLEIDHYVLILNGGVKELKIYDGVTYSDLPKQVSNGADLMLLDELGRNAVPLDIYYFFAGTSLGWITTPIITSFINTGSAEFHLKGIAWRNCLVKIQTRSLGDNYVDLAPITGVQFVTGATIPNVPVDAIEYQLTFCGLTCELYQTEWLDMTVNIMRGVNHMQIGQTNPNPFKVN